MSEDIKPIKTIADLVPDDKNANRGTERGRKMIEQSLRRFGVGRSIVVDRHGKIIGGNKTTEAAFDIGIEDIVVVPTDGRKLVVVQRTDLDMDTQAEARAMAVADNRTSEIGLEWDTTVLADLQADDPEVFDGLFSDDELDALLADVASDGAGNPADDPGAQVDKAAELQAKWGTALGQIWQVGEHRLACGDCRDAVLVERLMAGERAGCMWTDPPYGVEYIGKTKAALTIENDGADGLSELLRSSLSVADAVALADGAAIYIAHPPGALSATFIAEFIACGWRLHQTLVWCKDSMVLGHADYHYQHEPILYGYKNGAGRRGRGGEGWYGDNSQKSVFHIDRPKRSEEHPTMKPVELVEAMVINSSPEHGVVYEPFSGSGTTLIACERLGRRCRAIELDPGYVAVALQRWVDMTGKTPSRIED